MKYCCSLLQTIAELNLSHISLLSLFSEALAERAYTRTRTPGSDLASRAHIRMRESSLAGPLENPHGSGLSAEVANPIELESVCGGVLSLCFRHSGHSDPAEIPRQGPRKPIRLRIVVYRSAKVSET